MKGMGDAIAAGCAGRWPAGAPRGAALLIRSAEVVGDPDCGSLPPLDASSLLRGQTRCSPFHLCRPIDLNL